MELMERVQRFKRSFDAPEDPNLPWYRRKKYIMILIIGVVAILGVIVLFVGGFFAGMSAKRRKTDDTPDPQPRVLPPLDWDGVCPKKTGNCPRSFQGTPPLILVSLDGFHPSFLDRGLTPTIKNIASCGSHAPYMFSVFPTKTFPNHYSQVTGLFPSSHGIIDNTMYDPIKKKLFKVGQPESLNSYWWSKEPLWVTAQRQGKKTGCFFWPGSDIEINGTFPTYYKKYNSKISFDSRVDQVLKWLDLPTSSRPNLITLYVNQPDNALHNYGLNSKQANDALVKVNGMIERLFSGLQQRNLVNCVNVIIMSDHGMADTDCKHVVDIKNYINVDDTFNMVGPFGRIRPKGRRNATVVAELVSNLRCKSPHMRAYPKEQLPIRVHYADNPRIEPIFLDIDAGWTLISKGIEKDNSICTGGSHGYDNLFPEMRALFLAHGPSFKKNYTVQPFMNIELYEMLAELLDVSPNPNNGTRGSMHHIMTSPKIITSQKEPESPSIGHVPDDETVLRHRTSTSTCYCSESEKQREVHDVITTRNAHLPFGIPFSAEDNSSLYLLYNDDYINAFSLKYKIPLWSSFTIKEQKRYNKEENFCWNGDVRIPADSTPKCSDYGDMIENKKNILQRPLYPPGFSDPPVSEQGTFITNALAKSLNHSNIIEKPFNDMLNKWFTQSGEINVVTGPSFDIFATGVRPDTKEFMKFYERTGPVLIPTHIFVVTTWCSVKKSLNDCDSTKLQAQGFLLPNHPFPMNCEAAADIIIKNVARIVDIENLTGLSFYKKLPIYDAIRLRTMIPERSF